VPEHRLLRHELRQVVDNPVASLPPTQREVFLLHDTARFTIEEVTSILEMTANHQRVRPNAPGTEALPASLARKPLARNEFAPSRTPLSGIYHSTWGERAAR
jgi:hypothetical protein